MPAQRARIGKLKYASTRQIIILNVTTMLRTERMSAMTKQVVHISTATRRRRWRGGAAASSRGYYSQKPPANLGPDCEGENKRQKPRLVSAGRRELAIHHYYTSVLIELLVDNSKSTATKSKRDGCVNRGEPSSSCPKRRQASKNTLELAAMPAVRNIRTRQCTNGSNNVQQLHCLDLTTIGK